ncbi:Processing alpha glucosidase I [Mortierella sp. GBA30]|nr:Processing alpha glucosidase I [Mortierella sp. GBA30]
MVRQRPKTMRISVPFITLVGVSIFATGPAGANPSLDSQNSFLNNIGINLGSNIDDVSSISASAAQNRSLLWGIYRPNLYFGTRARLPDSVLTGLMWYGTQDYSGVDSELKSGFYNIRHGCEERDGFEKYGWLKHDGRSFGIQQLKDTRNNVELITEFIKVPGGDHGGSWGARISGRPIRKDEPMSISAMYYIGLDGDDRIKLDMDGFNAQSPVQMSGSTDGLGDFEFTLEQTKGINKRDPIHFAGVAAPKGTIWRVKDFEFEIKFNSGSSLKTISSKMISDELEKAVHAFDTRFEDTFRLKKHGYSESMVNFAKAAMSNLLGGIGYFHGSAIVDESPTYEDGMHDHLEGPVARRPNPNPQMTPPASLFTAVPSRSFFPRGFYWDEGFHQTLIGQWDNDLSLEIIESWYDRQDSDGWIQREQILGEEARSRVPSEFQVQYPEHANPPTLVQAISLYLDRLNNVTNVFSVDAFGESKQMAMGESRATKADVTNMRLLHPNLAEEFLTKLYPKLRTNYHWMRRTMQGGIREYGRQSRSRIEGYRWRGGTMTHTLTSGLDDYPRSPHPSIAELHVDLLSWIGFMSKRLEKIAKIIGEEDDAEEYEDHYKAIVANVDGIVDPLSEKLGHVLDLMYDPDELWSPYGLRSLSVKDELFGTGENYWKGPIWINLNYLALHSLRTNYFGEGPNQSKAKKIYNELRDNLINNIYNEYERTGYVWEQYNDKTGHGQRSHPFTGWSAMVVLIMQMGRAE